MTVQYSAYNTKSSAKLTAPQAFMLFRQDQVDLDPNEVARARRSRDYLHRQIQLIEAEDSTFPRITGEYQAFGSFARRTKVRPLDDIDILELLKGSFTEECLWSEQYTYKVKVTDRSSPLYRFADSDGYVNSTVILNKFKSGLQKIPNYQKAEIKRTGVAVVLNLKSYPWAFDIVPALPVIDWSARVMHYLIPNGAGKWMRTDPRRDQETITKANQQQNGNLIPLIRLIKYWNSYSKAAPRLGSYHLETMLINGLRHHYPPLTSTLRTHIPLVFRTLASQVLSSCPDPKGLGPNLDATVPWEDKCKVRDAANKRAEYADQALIYEQQGDHKNAIKYWGFVFPNFPTGGW